MSSINAVLANGNNSGNKSSSKTVWIVLGLCCCLVLCSLAGWGLWTWYKKDAETPAPTAPAPPADGEPVPPAPGTDCEASGSCPNKTGRQYFCPYPWDRATVEWDKTGMKPRCCTGRKQDYNGAGCSKSDGPLQMNSGAKKTSAENIMKFLKDMKAQNRLVDYDYDMSNNYKQACPCNPGQQSFNVKVKDGASTKTACLYLQSGGRTTCP